MEERRENIMGTQPINRLLPSMAFPIMLSMLVQALYNVVDSVFVAQLSEDALNAVSLAFPVQNLMIAVAVGTGVGINALLSKSLGEGNQAKADRTAMNGLFLSALSFLVFAVIGLTCSRLYFTIQTDIQRIVDYGESYMMICCVCSFGVFFQITLERTLQATGRTLYTMFTQATGAIINIILDPILMFVFHMGVRGAALATIISQGISAAWVVLFLVSNKSYLKIRTCFMRPKREILMPAIALGAAPFVMQFTESILNICFNTSLLKYGGDVAVGAMTIMGSVMQFSLLPLQGLTQGAQPIISFNYGAKKLDRVSRTFRLLLTSCMTYSTVLWAVAMFAPMVYIRIFTQDAALTAFSEWSIRIYMAASLLFGAQLACQQTFIAIGDSKTSLFLALLRKVILLIPLIYVLPNLFENKVFAVFVAEPIADTIAVCTTVTLFLLSFRKMKRELGANA